MKKFVRLIEAAEKQTTLIIVIFIIWKIMKKWQKCLLSLR